MGMIFGKATPGVAGIGPGMAQGVQVARGIQDIWNEQEERPLRRKVLDLQIANAERQGKLSDIELDVKQREQEFSKMPWNYQDEFLYKNADIDDKKAIDNFMTALPEKYRNTQWGKQKFAESINDDFAKREILAKITKSTAEKDLRNTIAQHEQLIREGKTVEAAKLESVIKEKQSKIGDVNKMADSIIGESKMEQAIAGLPKYIKEKARSLKSNPEAFWKFIGNNLEPDKMDMDLLAYRCKDGDNASCEAYAMRAKTELNKVYAIHRGGAGGSRGLKIADEDTNMLRKYIGEKYLADPNTNPNGTIQKAIETNKNIGITSTPWDVLEKTQQKPANVILKLAEQYYAVTGRFGESVDMAIMAYHKGNYDPSIVNQVTQRDTSGSNYIDKSKMNQNQFNKALALKNAGNKIENGGNGIVIVTGADGKQSKINLYEGSTESPVQGSNKPTKKELPKLSEITRGKAPISARE